jgi:CheY-like chemotaxis protein/two-component sensor histidine kinase
MLRSGSLSRDEREKALASIERNATSQTRIIEDLLDIGRIITGKMELHVGSVDIVQVVETAVATIRPAADAKGLQLHLTIDTDAPSLPGDAGRIRQILSNLLANAVKFTPRGGSILVELRRKPTHMEILVKDTGMGIPEEFLPFLFDGFRQADAGSTRSHGGLGVGLAIVQKLLELHGGTVHAQSAGAEQGASFLVCLPIADVQSNGSPPVRPSPAVPAVAPARLDSLHVLVVDDESDARDLLAAVLEHGKVKVTTASTAAEALQILSKQRPHVLVSDIGMPIEDGYALIEKVRALTPEEGGRTPAVALTAYAGMEDRTRALMAGFNMHVPKPIDPLELLAVVANLAGQRRSQ